MNMKRLLFSFLMLVGFSSTSWAQLTEDFNTMTGSYSVSSRNLSSGTWTFSQAYAESSGNSRGNSGSACRINDDINNAHATTPTITSGVGTVSFYYRALNNDDGTFDLQISVDGGSFTTLASQNYSGSTYTLFTHTVNNASTDIRLRVLNDDQAGHVIIDDFEATAFIISNCSAEPSTQAENLQATNGSATSIDLSWNAATGANNYIVVAREANSVNFTPTDGTDYSSATGSGDFTAATSQGNSNKVVYAGNGTSTTVTGLSAGTAYFFQVFAFCSDDNFNYLTTAGTGNDGSTSYTPQISYCSGGPTSNGDSEIENVTLDGVGSADINNNTTGQCTGSSGGFINDFTAQSADLEINGTYTVSVEFGDCNDGTQYDGAGGVWIDWNADGDFDDANEEIGTVNVDVSAGNVIEDFTINVPSGQQIGNYRMRIVQTESASSGSISPCGAFSWGSIEDYTINVISSLLAFPPQALTATSTSLSSLQLDFTTNASGENIVIAQNTTNAFTNPTDGQTYTVGQSLGSATIIYNGNGSTLNLSALDGNTTYYFEAWSVNSSNEYSPSISTNELTQSDEGVLGSTVIEDFSNIPASNGSYLTRNWTGTNGISWTAYKARTDRTIDGNAICLEDASGSELVSGTISGGITTLSVTTRRAFGSNGDIGSCEVFVNSTSLGTITVGDNAETFSFNNIDVSGDFTITIENDASERAEIDNLTWVSPNNLQQDISSGGNWSSTSTWGEGAVPSSALDVAIEANTTVDGNFTVEKLVVNNGVTLTIASGNSLTLTEGITNNGTIIVENDGALLQSGSDVNNGSGSYQVKRNSSPLVDETRFNFWSSPLQSTTLGSAFPNSNSADFYTYNNSSWGSSLAAATTMTPGVGYTATGDPNADYTNPVTANINFTGNQVNNGDVTVSGLNGDYILIGNPYPSGLSASDLIANTDINAVYFWDHQNATNYSSQNGNQDSDYAVFNGSGGIKSDSGNVVPSGNIGTGQGFMAQFSTTQSGGSLTFSNDWRTATNNQFFSPIIDESKVRTWLNLTNENGAFNQILVALFDETTDELDVKFDAPRVKANPSLSFYSKLNAADYAIQALAKPTPMQGKVVELGVDAWETGEYTIELDSLGNWPTDYTLELVDVQEGVKINLLETESYTFDVTQIGSIAQRFYLNINKKLDQNNTDNKGELATSTEEVELENIKVYQAFDQLWVDALQTNVSVQQIDVITVNGQLVASQRVSNNKTRHNIATSGFAQGIYLVKITATNGSTINQKVFIK